MSTAMLWGKCVKLCFGGNEYSFVLGEMSTALIGGGGGGVQLCLGGK